MPLQFYNTLTRTLQPFTPVVSGQVAMYVCGVTVYDHCHLGHARSYIVWDVVRRYLQWSGYSVRYVQNFTDIDDKILKRAAKEGTSMQAVSETYIAAYKTDMARLNILPADAYPRATGVIPEIITLIQTLIERDYAYAVAGDVYYAVDRFPGYGKLSGRQLTQMEAGASGRVDEDTPRKRHPLDFALWKAAKIEELSMYTPWDSPWGLGRPGWHIECSAMVQQAFAQTIDIHAGGMDLIFPHHENEIAQSEAVTRSELANVWLHNGFVNIEGEKMSKSLGNFTTIRTLLDSGVNPMAVRLFVLQAQYRKPLDFTEAAVVSAQNSWHTLEDGLQFGYIYGPRLGWSAQPEPALTAAPTATQVAAIGTKRDWLTRFNQAMDDDLNTPNAVVVVFEIAKELRRQGNLLDHVGAADQPTEQLQQDWQMLVSLAQVLGLPALPPTTKAPTGPSDTEIADLIAQRQQARQTKNYAEGDRIRHLLKEQGITLVDTPGGTTHWLRDD
jgi:cysteinyl-tRNA synthetase